jgi:hypothetical protein
MTHSAITVTMPIMRVLSASSGGASENERKGSADRAHQENGNGKIGICKQLSHHYLQRHPRAATYAGTV